MKLTCRLIKRECLQRSRSLSDISHPLIFFAVVVMLFPLSITPEPSMLQLIAPGIIWVAALLAVFLSLEQLFRPDYEDGSLEQALCYPGQLSYLLLMKITAHWLMICLPLIVLSPIVCMMFHLTWSVCVVMMLSLLFGSASLMLLGAQGAALTVGLANRGLLLALIILPLSIPILIFGTSSVIHHYNGEAFLSPLLLLVALFIFCLSTLPFSIAATLRHS